MRNQKRNLNEWMDVITKCRQSGFSDADWCEQNGISVSCFYNAVSRLRKKDCEVPAPLGKANVIDITSAKQDVVEVSLTLDSSQEEAFSCEKTTLMYLDNSHTIEIAANGMVIKLNNSVNPVLLDKILHVLRAPLC